MIFIAYITSIMYVHVKIIHHIIWFVIPWYESNNIWTVVVCQWSMVHSYYMPKYNTSINRKTKQHGEFEEEEPIETIYEDMGSTILQ